MVRGLFQLNEACGLYCQRRDSNMSAVPNYDITRIIGSGCFGYVFEAQDRHSRQKVALKRIEKVGNQLSREYEILHMIRGLPNVVQMQNFFYSKNDSNKLIQNIVFEYLEDNLESVVERTLRNKQRLSEASVKDYVYQLLNGLRLIHQKNIAHRDLKPENVLLSKEGRVKICDFGSSKVIDPKGKNTPYIVSRYYRAPELILCLTRYSTAIDVWAAGCILAELFLLDPLFKGKTEGDQLFAIFRVLGSLSEHEAGEYKKRVPFEESLIDSFGQFRRVSLKELFREVEDRGSLIDLLLRMLAYLPEERISAEEAMKHPFFRDVAAQSSTP